MRDITEIGKIIRFLRGDLSLREFASKCDVSHTTIDNIEKGVDFRTGKPVQIKITTIEKIADACEVNISYIIGDNTSDNDDTLVNEASNNTKYVDVPVYRSITTSKKALWIRDDENYVPLEREIAQTGKFSALKLKEGNEIRTYIFRHQDTIPFPQQAIILHEGEPAFVAVAVTIDDKLIVNTQPDPKAKIIGAVFKSMTLLYPYDIDQA